jgi:hypothetical protein
MECEDAFAQKENPFARDILELYGVAAIQLIDDAVPYFPSGLLVYEGATCDIGSVKKNIRAYSFCQRPNLEELTTLEAQDRMLAVIEIIYVNLIAASAVYH